MGNLRVAHLSSFTSLADTSSLTSTAAILSYSCSSINYHVRTLERELGLRLVRRSGDLATLTLAGGLLLAPCQEVLLAVGRVEATAADLLATIPGRHPGACGGAVDTPAG